eukprot:366198-Chlamydomonas_euryale.AAC.6
MITTSRIWASSSRRGLELRRGSRIARNLCPRLRSLCSLGRAFLLLPRAWRLTRDRRPREERCDPGLVMLGNGRCTPALWRRGPKRYLSTSLLTLGSAFMDLLSTASERAEERGV